MRWKKVLPGHTTLADDPLARENSVQWPTPLEEGRAPRTCQDEGASPISRKQLTLCPGLEHIEGSLRAQL